MIFLGFGLGLLVACLVVGYRHGRQVYMRQYEAEIPKWVNQGNQATVIPLADLEDEINFAIWELEMGDR